MLSICVLVLSILTASWSAELDFPPGFQFGVASSAYQTEGSWNVSGKGESIWDRFLHSRPEGDNGDVACDSYRQWKRDVDMLEELGVDFYRFSIPWPRMLPSGFATPLNKEAVQHYSDMIDALLLKGIEPVITLYHWDLPQRLQDLGGWTNPLIADWFADYARTVFTLYADRVKTWITLNEPAVFCHVPYQLGIMAPGIVSPDVGSMLCSKHALMAHAKAWRVYDEEFRHKYHGTYDFFGLNYYTSRIVRRANESEVLQPFPVDAPLLRAKMATDPSWETTGFYIYPKHAEGVRKQLSWLRNEYGNQTFLITENGVCVDDGLNDKNRVIFLKDYMEQVLLAIKEDGVNVTSYTAWSFMDNLEWGDGYGMKFGLYQVDFSSPARTRKPRSSALYYSRVIAGKSLNVSYDDIITIDATTSPASHNVYIFSALGAVLVIAIAGLTMHWFRKRTKAVQRKNSYVGVKTEER